jgi:hypothetical protein
VATTVVDQSAYFNLKVNGKSVPVKNMDIANTITITPSKTIHFGDVVTIGYTPGGITATDQSKLEKFSGFAVTNPIVEPAWLLVPGKIEAEKYTSQFGVQTKATGDTDGAKDVSSIDNGDWLEYAINNTTDTLYVATFRFSSPSDSGIVTVYLDDVKIGQVYCINKGGQAYYSIDTILGIRLGKHYLKLYATKGGFDINYLEFRSKTTGVKEVNSGQIKVYPNPVSRELYIESVWFKYNKVEIIDIMGKTVLSRLTAHEPVLHIPVDLPNGTYIVKISNGKQFQLKRIIIENN